MPRNITLTPQQLIGWATALNIVITVGGAAIDAVKAMLGRSGLTEDEQNLILDELEKDKDRRRAISEAIVNG